MEILNYVWETICSLARDSGLAALFAEGGWRNAVMIVVACVLFYLAIKKEFEPLLLLPIAFGMLLANLPLAGLTTTQTTELIPLANATATEIAIIIHLFKYMLNSFFMFLISCSNKSIITSIH